MNIAAILFLAGALLGGAAGALSAGDAEPAVDAMFQDHLVLQRGMPVPVWGTAAAGTTVRVVFRGQSASGTADDQGAWLVRLAPMPAQHEPAELVITIGEVSRTCTDVLVGDVYFCSGQSNMAMVMRDFPSTAADQAEATLPGLRYLRVGGDAPAPAKKAPAADSAAVGETDGVVLTQSGRWLPCTPATVGEFSATGFYFARKLLRETGVPVGLINNAKGSSRIERWIPPEGFALVPGLVRPDGKLNQRPSDRYGHFFSNTRRIIPFAIRGMLWYQGEHNTWAWDDEVNYCAKMNAMVVSLRRLWGQGDFPFYYVQLPQFGADNADPAGGGAWARVRLGQLRALSVIPDAHMAITLDNSEHGIHPDNKQEVGERLALLALARDHGRKELTSCGPLFKAMHIDGGRIRISFDHVGKGLMVGIRNGRQPAEEVPGGTLARFAVAGVDPADAQRRKLRWVWAEAVIDGDTVVVSSPEISVPVAVHYANCDRPTGANLFNKDGLPASPFVARAASQPTEPATETTP